MIVCATMFTVLGMNILNRKSLDIFTVVIAMPNL